MSSNNELLEALTILDVPHGKKHTQRDLVRCH